MSELGIIYQADDSDVWSERPGKPLSVEQLAELQKARAERDARDARQNAAALEAERQRLGLQRIGTVSPTKDVAAEQRALVRDIEAFVLQAAELQDAWRALCGKVVNFGNRTMAQAVKRDVLNLATHATLRDTFGVGGSIDGWVEDCLHAGLMKKKR